MRQRNRLRRVVDIRLDEPRAVRQAEFIGQRPRRRDCGRGEIQPDHRRTLLRQAQCVGTEMALQMQDALAGDWRQFGLLDRAQPSPPSPQVRQGHSRAGRDARRPVRPSSRDWSAATPARTCSPSPSTVLHPPAQPPPCRPCPPSCRRRPVSTTFFAAAKARRGYPRCPVVTAGTTRGPIVTAAGMTRHAGDPYPHRPAFRSRTHRPAPFPRCRSRSAPRACHRRVPPIAGRPRRPRRPPARTGRRYAETQRSPPSSPPETEYAAPRRRRHATCRRRPEPRRIAKCSSRTG